MFALPIEMYKYIDSSNGKTIIVSSAPQWIKDKAREIDRLSLKNYGELFFDSIE